MSGDAALGAAFAEWMVAWMATAGGLLLLAFVLPLDRWASRLSGWLRRVDATRGGTAALLLLLAAVAAAFRLPYLDADPPARMLTFAAAFGTDEGVWAHLATAWCLGRDPLGGPEYLAGAFTLPFTSMQWLSCQLGGLDIVSVRLVPAIAGMLMAPVLYLASRRWLGVPGALCAGLLVATSFLLTMYQRTGMVDGLIALLGIGVLGLWSRALMAGKRWAIATGLLLGLTLWVKISAVVLFGGLVAASWAATEVSWRERGRQFAWLGVGVAPVALFVVIIYAAAPRLAMAASSALAVNVHPPPLHPLAWADRLLQALARDTSFVHTPLLMTIALGGTLIAAVVLRRKLRVAPGVAFAAGWWLSNVIMLAHHGYLPTRYTLQTVAPMLLIALYALRAAWLWLGTQSWPIGRVRSAMIAVVIAEVLFGAYRYAAWLPQRQYSQRDVGQFFGQLTREDSEQPRVSGPWSFNLALSGDFEPMGFWPEHPPTIQQAAAAGASHFLTAGPIPFEQMPRHGPIRLRLRGRFTYYANYFEPKADLHLYAIDAVRQ